MKAIIITIISLISLSMKAQSIKYSNISEMGYCESGKITEKINPDGMKIFMLGRTIWMQRFDSDIAIMFTYDSSTQGERNVTIMNGSLHTNGETVRSQCLISNMGSYNSIMFMLDKDKQKSLIVIADVKEQDYTIKQ